VVKRSRAARPEEVRAAEARAVAVGDQAVGIPSRAVAVVDETSDRADGDAKRNWNPIAS
jgi:hypothetical protein